MTGAAGRRHPSPISRRQVGALGLAMAGAGVPVALRGEVRARVVVIGGGAGGATCARHVAQGGHGLVGVSLIEANPQYTSCFFSNHHLAGWRSLRSLTYGYAGLQAAGVSVVPQRAAAVDPAARRVLLEDGGSIPYDRLVVAPGIGLKFGSIEGYSEGAAEIMPHSWTAGAQTALLRSQLEAMPDGGLFVIAVPPEPYRCPPAPYERASVVAHYFTQAKPRSKILILDAKGSFSKQALFEEAWRGRYKGMVEWVPGELGGLVRAVDARAMTLTTALGDVHRPDVANIIPAQEAGRIAHQAGLVDASGWCPVRPADMASRRQPDIHVLGDAAVAGAMPKSAAAAHSQAKVVASEIIAGLTGVRSGQAQYQNTCWSVLAPGDAVKVGAHYAPGEDRFESVDPFISKVGEDPALRRRTRSEADAWYETITADIFG